MNRVSGTSLRKWNGSFEDPRAYLETVKTLGGQIGRRMMPVGVLDVQQNPARQKREMCYRVPRSGQMAKIVDRGHEQVDLC